MTDLLILLIDNLKFFGIKLINSADFLELIVRFFFNLAIIMVIVRYFYYSISRRKDYFFTYLLVAIIVFLITFSLANAEKLSVGVALGLFALFGILRFRTAQIPIKEMTYLFIVIGVSVINALVTKKTSYSELLFINLAILVATWAGERIWITANENRKTIIYEKIDLIKPEKRKEMIEDLRNRTGLDITHVQIGRINFLRDSARIRIFYKPLDTTMHLDDEADGNIDNDTI